jgi:5-methyltetrahydropteroyltriglutamate--homocysteine methyltransferase
VPPISETERELQRLEAGLKHVPVTRLIASPDCGMKYLPRDLARAKLAALTAGATLVTGTRT